MPDPLTSVQSQIIRTPDQRLRVFVSSTLQELADERIAAREAIEHLRLTPVMFELGARPHPPKDLYRAYLDQSHIFIGIYWQKYGWVAPDMTISGLEDECNLSGQRPKLIYLKSPALDRESRLKDLLDRIRDDDRVSYKSFATAAELRELIENDLALLLTEHFEQARSALAPSTAPASPPRHNLPTPPTRLIGREKELVEIQNHLLKEDVRLVTLTGPGGTGKTRLATQVAFEILPHFSDGVYFVALASITDPVLIIPSIAQVLDVRESGEKSLGDLLKAHLYSKQLLLVLDNFEQVIDGAATVGEIAHASPHIKILVTSRTPLHLRGEMTYPVSPLALPDRKRIEDVEQLSHYAAVELFIQRAVSVKPDFKATNESAPAIAEICHRLDGLPLAIELAAARVNVLPPQVLLTKLERSLDVLRGGARDLPVRQQTLRNTISWSYDLLTPAEKKLFSRLAVFAGSCTLQAAEFIGNLPEADQSAPGLEFLDTLESLVGKSLLKLQETSDIEPRFTMLETIHEYAVERLNALPNAAEVRHRHAEYYLTLAGQAKQGLNSDQQSRWLRYLDKEHDNLRAALQWAVQQHAESMAVQTAGLIWRFWYLRGYLSEGRKWLTLTVEAARHQQLPPADWVEALNGAAALANNQGDLKQAEQLHTECLTLRRELGNPRGIAVSLNNLGLVLENQGNYRQAIDLYEESLGLFRALQNEYHISGSLTNLGNAYMLLGDFTRAADYQEESLKLHRRQGEEWGIALALVNLAQVMIYLENYPRAIALCEESEKIHHEMDNENEIAFPHLMTGRAYLGLGDLDQSLAFTRDSLTRFQKIEDPAAIAECLFRLAIVFNAKGQTQPAVVLMSAQDSWRAARGTTLPPADRAEYEQCLIALRNQLGETKFDAAWQAGSRFDLDQAAAYALSAS